MASERISSDRKELACSDVLAYLGDFLDGELAPELLEKVRAHVAGCSACDRFGGAYAAAVEALRKAPVEAPLEADLVASILAKAE
jgi:anti-sigma factor RsiW